MKWEIPPTIKVYEALGSIADGRLEVDKDQAKAYSSSKGKFYTITCDKEKNQIMCNDNASFFVGYLGYPSIAYLMMVGELSFSKEYAEALKGIAWKDLNQKFKNDFSKTQVEIDGILDKKGVDPKKVKTFAEKVMGEIKQKSYSHLGKKKFPPKGY